MLSSFFQWFYPDENTDPWFDGFQEFVNDQEATVYGLMSAALGGNIITGGGAVSFVFNGTTGVLSWTDDFQIPLLSSGFYLNVKYGPDNVTRQMTLHEGDRVVVTVPSVAANNVNANFYVINGKINPDFLTGLFTFGIMKGGKFWANTPLSIGNSAQSQFLRVSNIVQPIGAGFQIDPTLSSYISVSGSAPVISDPSHPIISSAGSSGLRLLIDNIGVYDVTFKFSSNIDLPNSFDLTLTPGSAAEFVWNAISNKWRCIGSSVL